MDSSPQELRDFQPRFKASAFCPYCGKSIPIVSDLKKAKYVADLASRQLDAHIIEAHEKARPAVIDKLGIFDDAL